MGWGAGEGLHTLFEIGAFLRLRSLRLFLTESHSPFTCHRQRSSSILRSFERRPSPQTVIKDMYCHKFKATAPLIIPSKQKKRDPLVPFTSFLFSNALSLCQLHHKFFHGLLSLCLQVFRQAENFLLYMTHSAHRIKVYLPKH